MTLTAILILSIVAGFILERRLMVRDMATERREWATERAALINREPVLPPGPTTVEHFNSLPLDGPDADEAYWDEVKS